MDGLSLGALKGTHRAEVPENDEKVVRAYIRLCEDECELRREGLIADATWHIWSDGMRTLFKRWPFVAMWERVRDEDKARYKYPRGLLSGDESALTPTRLKRLTSGLAGRGGV